MLLVKESASKNVRGLREAVLSGNNPDGGIEAWTPRARGLTYAAKVKLSYLTSVRFVETTTSKMLAIDVSEGSNGSSNSSCVFTLPEELRNAPNT
jgi:hypothetical protein